MSEVNVQTTVSEAVYNSLWRLAKSEKLPLKTIVRQAIEEHLAKSSPVKDDPLMDFVGRGRLKGTSWSTRKDWRA